MKKAVLVLIVGAFALPVFAEPSQPAPWTEAVVSVRDIAKSGQLLREIGQWRPVESGRLSRAELDYWRLPTGTSGSFQLLCAPGVKTGCVRFVQFKGVEQRPIRLAARAWDTGGIFSLMMRSDDVPRVFDRAIAMGWWAESEVYSFRFGASDLKNVVLTGPDGLNIALYQRVSPPFTAFKVGTISQAFNTMRMVRDQPLAVAFYRDVLGFSTAFNSDFVDPQPTIGNFSIPTNFTTKITRKAAAMSPAPSETGRVELMQFAGFEGRDFATYARAPNLGILSVRYPVADLPAYRRAIEAKGAIIISGSDDVQIPGLGKTALISVRDPDGNVTEFYQAKR